MSIYTDEIKKSLIKLDAKVDELNQVIDEKTNKIREIEHELNSRKLYLPFKTSVYANDPIEAILSWERDPRQKKTQYRLFVELKKDGKTEFKKILIEAKLETKLEMINYLEPFVQNFTKFLVDLQKRSLTEK